MGAGDTMAVARIFGSGTGSRDSPSKCRRWRGRRRHHGGGKNFWIGYGLAGLAFQVAEAAWTPATPWRRHEFWIGDALAGLDIQVPEVVWAPATPWRRKVFWIGCVLATN